MHPKPVPLALLVPLVLLAPAALGLPGTPAASAPADHADANARWLLDQARAAGVPWSPALETELEGIGSLLGGVDLGAAGVPASSVVPHTGVHAGRVAWVCMSWFVPCPVPVVEVGLAEPCTVEQETAVTANTFSARFGAWWFVPLTEQSLGLGGAHWTGGTFHGYGCLLPAYYDIIRVFYGTGVWVDE